MSLFTWKTFILSVLWCLGVIRRAAFFQVFEEIQNISSSEQNKIVSKLTGSSFVLKNVLQRGNFVCQNQRCWNKFIWNRHTWTLDNSYVYFYLKNYYRELKYFKVILLCGKLLLIERNSRRKKKLLLSMKSKSGARVLPEIFSWNDVSDEETANFRYFLHQFCIWIQLRFPK